MPKLVPFPEYAPDVSPLGQAESQAIFNVVPKADGYGPVQTLVPHTDALPGPCRGYFYGRRVDGSISIFAGTDNDLWIMSNTTLVWEKVSKAGGYATVPVGDNWVFAQFNDLVIAVQQNAPPQKFALSTAGAFVDLAGNPPFAGSIAIIGFFVVLTALQENKLRAHWSDLDAPEMWDVGIGLCDFQDFPDGGICIAASGGDAFGLIFQEQSMRSMTYSPGNPAIFQFYRISTQEVLYAKHSIVNVGNRVYYLGAAGFKEIVGSTSDPVPIGKEKVDRTFFAEVDASAPNLILGASAPSATRIYFAYKSKLEGLPGLFDRILIFDYVLRKWSRVNMFGEFIASLAKPGLTLEAMDQFATPQLMVEDAYDNGAGLIRLKLDAVYKPTFDLAAQPFATVQGVVGTFEANGVWSFNIIDDTHADLVGSTFVHPYESGGAIGGSIEDIPFSFDSVIKAAIAQLSAFDSSHRLGFFSGPNMEATLETGEADGEGKLLFTDTVEPITDATQTYCSIGWRHSPQANVNYTEENLIDEHGQAGIDPIESRYQRIRIRIESGTFWIYARGVQPFTQSAGER